jgi:murein DD-endopeptidase MepM/ murein hydrolase activator NlpD
MPDALDYFPLPAGTYSWGSPFGPRSGGWHGGYDLPAPTGTPLYAVCAGTVWQSWDASGGGNWTRLVADDGSTFGYGHASAFALPPEARNGSRVEAGELLAWVGSTGHSTGAHLHFAYRPRWATTYTNPAELLAAAEAAGRFVNNTPPQEAPDVTKAELDQALADHISGLQSVLGTWLQEVEARIKAADMSSDLIAVQEVRDQLGAIADKLGVTLPAIDVNSHRP